MRGSHLLPDQLPGEHTGYMPQAARRSSWYNRLHCCHSHTHSHMVTADRSMVVGYVPTVHTCSFMCTSHIDMIAHTPAFVRVGEHSPSSGLTSCKHFFGPFFFFFFLAKKKKAKKKKKKKKKFFFRPKKKKKKKKPKKKFFLAKKKKKSQKKGTPPKCPPPQIFYIIICYARL